MARATAAYPRENSPTMRRRQLLAAAILYAILPEPIPPPIPTTCLPSVQGKAFQYDD
jgi:hypothetical protein